MSDEKKVVELGDIPEKAPGTQSEELTDQDLDTVSGGRFIRSRPPSGSKGTYMPAPPAPPIPIPYPSGM